MEFLLILTGILIYIAIVTDIVKTTVSLHAGGWLTTPVSNGVWKLFFVLAGRNGRSGHLEHAGYIIVLLILILWILLLWTSFFLMLLSHTDSVLESATRSPAGLWEKFYYAGFTISTLGVGDYQAGSNVWRIVTTVYSFTGLFLITMAITYFLSVLSGVVEDRQLGIMLASLGKTPQEIVLNSWDGRSFNRLIAQASQISSALVRHSQNHKAFPVIHYFHTSIPTNTTVLRIACLHEALVLLRYFVRKDIMPDFNDLAGLQSGIDNYLDVINTLATLDRNDVPTTPRSEKLASVGLKDETNNSGLIPAEVEKKRTAFFSLIRQDGWKWAEVEG